MLRENELKEVFEYADNHTPIQTSNWFCQKYYSTMRGGKLNTFSQMQIEFLNGVRYHTVKSFDSSIVYQVGQRVGQHLNIEFKFKYKGV